MMEGCPRIAGAIGFDVDDITLAVARRNLDRFTHLMWDVQNGRYRRAKDDEVPTPAPLSCILQLDLTHLADLSCVTHAYCFCNGMPADVIRHMFRVCSSTRTLRYLVLVYKKLSGDTAFELVKALRDVTSVHEFVDEASGASLLKMPGQTAHGCCIHMSATVKRVMHQAAEGVVVQRPLHTMDACFRYASPTQS